MLLTRVAIFWNTSLLSLGSIRNLDSLYLKNHSTLVGGQDWEGHDAGHLFQEW